MPTYTTTIEQALPFAFTPVQQDLIIIVGNSLAVANETGVKFCLKVSLIDTTVIGNFKTTPNNEGYGVFDVSSIVTNYVSADNEAVGKSQYKEYGAKGLDRFPLHIIDKYSLQTKALRQIQFDAYTEYTDSDGVVVQTNSAFGGFHNFFNGYVKETDKLSFSSSLTNFGTGAAVNGGFGYDTEAFKLKLNYDPPHKFLSNSPSIQWATRNDYGTMAFFPKWQGDAFTSTLGLQNHVHAYRVITYTGLNATGSQLSVIDIDRTYLNGAYDGNSSFTDFLDIEKELLIYFGAFPANLYSASSTFASDLDTKSRMQSYTVHLIDESGEPLTLTEIKIINILCPTLKGYEPIRLAWLNQWGTWDYFTFNQKSTKTISTKGSTYNQLGGDWNKRTFYPKGYKGGKKSFRVNATEKIKMNTDFITEEHSEWFEELINSPEVYIIKGWESPRHITNTNTFDSLNTYATPVRLTTTSFTKKTVANDKLIQYTFEVEKSKTLNTQSI